MSLTLDSTAIRQHFVNNHSFTIPIVHDNQPAQKIAEKVVWARFSVRHGASYHAAGSAETGVKINQGRVWLQVFVPEQSGTGVALEALDAFAKLFNNVRLNLAGSVSTVDVSVTRIHDAAIHFKTADISSDPSIRDGYVMFSASIPYESTRRYDETANLTVRAKASNEYYYLSTAEKWAEFAAADAPKKALMEAGTDPFFVFDGVSQRLNSNNEFNDGVTNWWQNFAGTTPVQSNEFQSSFEGRSNVIISPTGVRRNIHSEMIAIDPNKNYRVRAHLHHSTLTMRHYAGVYCYDAAGNGLGYRYPTGNLLNLSGWNEAIGTITGVGASNNSFMVGTASIRVIAFLNFNSEVGQQGAVDSLWIEDLT